MTRRALLIDLDETLYQEHTYVASGFRHVAALVSPRCGHSSEEVYLFLEDRLRATGRGRVFDDLLLWCGLPATSDSVGKLVEAYRNHRPTISLAEDVRRTLRQLRRRFAIGIVTDGLGPVQRRKVDALGIDQLVDTVVYCWEHRHPKPSPAGFYLALDNLGDTPAAAVVGDDVRHDLPAAVALGVPFIRVRAGRFAWQHTPVVSVPVMEVSSFPHVPSALADLELASRGL
jgi:putative hydrolase of the HAD superfamily